MLLFIMTPLSGGAYETDQFSHRLEPIDDSTATLDAKVNQTIQDIVNEWEGTKNNWAFVNEVFHRIGGHHWVDKIEAWVMESPEIDRLRATRRESIYQGHPFWATRVAGLFGVGPTILVNHQLIGSDKLGHFLSQGRKFYRRYLISADEEKAAKQSAFTERALFGQMTTGVYSNADLVANYEGYLFYRSLFEDNIAAEKPAILIWSEDQWHIQRDFTWADHVNPYWDEALNVNHFDNALYPHMKTRLLTFCPDYEKAPHRFKVEDDEKWQQRYSKLQLRDTSELRLDQLCENQSLPESNLKPLHTD